MVPDIHAKFNNQPFIMRRAIYIFFIYHHCLEACQLVLLIKSTPIVLMASQIILNSTCWPAMKIAVKLETATYALMLKLACLSSALLHIYNIYIFISCIVYRLFYFTSRNCISSCLLFIYLNNVVCTCSCLLFTYVYSVFSRSCIIVIMVTLKYYCLTLHTYNTVFHCQILNYVSNLMGGSHASDQLVPL